MKELATLHGVRFPSHIPGSKDTFNARLATATCDLKIINHNRSIFQCRTLYAAAAKKFLHLPFTLLKKPGQMQFYWGSIYTCRVSSFQSLFTVWCNQMGTVFSEMSSWAALQLYKMSNTTFQTKNMKSESFGILTIKVLNFESDLKICIFKEIQHITTRNS